MEECFTIKPGSMQSLEGFSRRFCRKTLDIDTTLQRSTAGVNEGPSLHTHTDRHRQRQTETQTHMGGRAGGRYLSGVLVHSNVNDAVIVTALL